MFSFFCCKCVFLSLCQLGQLCFFCNFFNIIKWFKKNTSSGQIFIELSNTSYFTRIFENFILLTMLKWFKRYALKDIAGWRELNETFNSMSVLESYRCHNKTSPSGSWQLLNLKSSARTTRGTIVLVLIGFMWIRLCQFLRQPINNGKCDPFTSTIDGF